MDIRTKLWRGFKKLSQKFSAETEFHQIDPWKHVQPLLLGHELEVVVQVALQVVRQLQLINWMNRFFETETWASFFKEGRAETLMSLGRFHVVTPRRRISYVGAKIQTKTALLLKE
jgi:hypothetical protein